jgi:TRAP-type C4-dicarboxylate transport system permease small subunit
MLVAGRKRSCAIAQTESAVPPKLQALLHSPGKIMNATKLVATLLIAAGALTLIYGGFNYTRETSSADIGPLHLQIKETQRVNIPLWAGLGAIVGGVLLLVTARKS